MSEFVKQLGLVGQAAGGVFQGGNLLIVAGAVLKVFEKVAYTDVDSIRFVQRTVRVPSAMPRPEDMPEAHRINALHLAGRAHELPYKEMALTTVVAEAARIVSLENGPESYPFYLSAVKIGDLVFAGIGGEPFTEIGNRICAESPFKETILCALTNSEGGYIPTRKAYDEGGYEAKSSPLRPGGDDIIVEGMRELLREL